MKVRCIKQYKQFEGMLDLGDEIDLEMIYSDKDKVIQDDFYLPINPFNPRGEKFLSAPAVIAPAGTYEGFRFTSKNGLVYTDYVIRHGIGNFVMSELFEKI